MYRTDVIKHSSDTAMPCLYVSSLEECRQNKNKKQVKLVDDMLDDVLLAYLRRRGPVLSFWLRKKTAVSGFVSITVLSVIVLKSVVTPCQE